MEVRDNETPEKTPPFIEFMEKNIQTFEVSEQLAELLVFFLFYLNAACELVSASKQQQQSELKENSMTIARISSRSLCTSSRDLHFHVCLYSKFETSSISNRLQFIYPYAHTVQVTN